MEILTDIPATVLLIGSFLTMIILRLPIVFAIGISSVVTTLYLGLPLMMVAQNMVKGLNVFVLLAVPFFILAGDIMSAGGIADKLVAFATALVGWMRGGLAMVNILASMFFGGISGSSAADTTAIGKMLIPMMKKKGYDESFSTAVTITSSVQGVLVPPSHNMVIYALAAGGVSIGGLFLAGMVPGVLLGIALMVYAYIASRVKNYPTGNKFEMRELCRSFWDALLGLGTVLIVVIGVISGIFTATESAAVATAYAFFITFFVYRKIPLSEIWPILTRSIKTLGIVMILIGTSTAFGWLLAFLKVPALIAQGIFTISENPIIVLLIINLFLLFMGMLMDMSSLILICTPILLPIAKQIGIDPIHFGVIMVLNLGIGLLTPPVGSTLFLGSAISGVSIEKITKATLPFYIVMLVMLMAVTFIPALSMTMVGLFLS
ncbi:TRAP transporter, DctM subunit [Cohaesibacter sp. ES.047]|uniref:TRAP transporter large permease n=1 Tax=Cohaesibacter sp. ES.047 TaxID=1798205 RepID=UPI000BB86EAA|nr:TRAP transporter large permease [Cohaesibacter sp. ES.047]SNY90259.1 TRAP transporter, DctM subunit [Cohaesibacter sp. ES.047]